MPIIKHKLFSIEIDKTTVDFNAVACKQMDDFLSQPNYLYSSHSTSIFNKTAPSGAIVNSFLIVSIVYKDLNATEKDLKKVSKKTREVVRKSIENDDLVPAPQIQTEFEKRNKI